MNKQNSQSEFKIQTSFMFWRNLGEVSTVKTCDWKKRSFQLIMFSKNFFWIVVISGPIHLYLDSSSSSPSFCWQFLGTKAFRWLMMSNSMILSMYRQKKPIGVLFQFSFLQCVEYPSFTWWNLKLFVLWLCSRETSPYIPIIVVSRLISLSLSWMSILLQTYFKSLWNQMGQLACTEEK